jgi:hypothetical protein
MKLLHHETVSSSNSRVVWCYVTFAFSYDTFCHGTGNRTKDLPSDSEQIYT